MMYVKSIQANHQGRATAEVRICGVYDGTNAPIIPAGSIALTGLTPSAAEYFSLGPVEINTDTLDGVQDMSLDLGVETIERGSASEIFDTFIAIKQINPKFTIRGLATEPWNTYGLVGAELTAVSVYLRKLNNLLAGGIAYVADATAGHILLGATAGTITVEDTQAGGNGEAVTGLMLDIASPDTTTNPVTINTGSASFVTPANHSLEIKAMTDETTPAAAATATAAPRPQRHSRRSNRSAPTPRPCWASPRRRSTFAPTN